MDRKDMTTNSGHGYEPGSNPLIDHLWQQVRDAYEELTAARRSGSKHVGERLTQFRTLALLMAAEPARTWNDLHPKVLTQVLVRHDQAVGSEPAGTHLIDMLEAAIMADHATLNGDDPLH